ncbi:MAG: SDR family oxidoreductase [Ardenticatenaceae bacterium]
MSETVLVTGISGFVGQHCAVELLKQGFTVRGSLRNMAKESEVRTGINKAIDPNGKLEFCQLDLLKDEGWDEAMRGCTFVLHVASPFIIEEPKHEDELIKPAKEGTLRALKAAKKANVKRIVITSSTVAMSSHLKKGTFNHEAWTDFNDPSINTYTKSKIIAEQSAWDFINNQTGKNKLELSVINPGAISGPTLTNNLSGASMGLVSQLMTGKLPMIPDMSMVMVDVRDVAQLHVRAMTTKEANGKRFIAASDTAIPYLRVAKMLKANGYSKVSTRKAPTIMLRFMSLFDREAKGMLPFLGKQVNSDNSQTKNILGWRPTPLEKTVLDMAKSVEKALAVNVR